MDHVVVFKAAHHVDGGVRFADVGQEFIAQTLARAGTGDQACDIDKFDDGPLHLLRIDDGGERIKARIRHLHNAHVGLNRAKGVVFGRDACLGQGVEQG